jgi:hypothetical protein
MKVEGFWHEKARVFAEQLLCNYPPAGLAICGLNLATAQSQRYEHRPQRGAVASRPLLSVESQSDPGCDEEASVPEHAKSKGDCLEHPRMSACRRYSASGASRAPSFSNGKAGSPTRLSNPRALAVGLSSNSRAGIKRQSPNSGSWPDRGARRDACYMVFRRVQRAVAVNPHDRAMV